MGYCNRENPRLCRGGSSSLTFPGVWLSLFCSQSQHRLHVKALAVQLPLLFTG
jgi:hypothetical protein